MKLRQTDLRQSSVKKAINISKKVFILILTLMMPLFLIILHRVSLINVKTIGNMVNI